MTDDIHLAFAHPAERAAATSETLRDRISLRDHTVSVEIGAFQAERGTTQRIRFNVVVEVRPLDGPIEDDVDRILSYDRVTEAIATEIGAERINLLETLAERVAERILLEPQAVRTFVRIEKLDRGPGALGVEIVRTRRDGLRVVSPADTAVLHPRVVLLANEAVQSGQLSNWLDALERSGVPTILTVCPPQTDAPQTPVKMVQRRIDLLSLEQACWVLAGRDPRCVVVETATELDWGMRNGQISVWAPSKLVLDAVDTVPPGPEDPVVLAGWFAGQMAAAELVCVGVAAGPAECPVREVSVAADSLL
ncbi:dihydroneopterin aldolase [Aestuariibius insulae]|uniref:dihydroneopterin aldolase n=1 Tax=Aestuariibius insulae TaxID=2058287 RepID=UPI00345EFC97